MTFYHQVEAAQAAVRETEESYLRRWGWRPTCSTPGAYWMWERDFSDIDAGRNAWSDKHGRARERQYGIVCVDRAMAVSMTAKVLDEQPEVERIEG